MQIKLNVTVKAFEFFNKVSFFRSHQGHFLGSTHQLQITLTPISKMLTQGE